MRLTKKSEAINKTREDGTDISYYIFKEYEVHYGELAPGITQPWHHHTKINETVFVVEGNIKLHYLDNGEKKEKKIDPGDVVQVEDTPHTFSNPYQKVCKMVAFRFVPKGEDQHETIKNDKVLHPELD
jgi:uncharacterized cupin superfamily protein